MASEALERIAKVDRGVGDGYIHIEKLVTALAPVETRNAVFKWYDLSPLADGIPDEIATLARDYLRRNETEAAGIGFIILHRCGRDFYFLLVSTWRGNNELWETVLYKDGGEMTDFAIFAREGDHKPTFCVWEMAVVLHEQRAWVMYLRSPRDGEGAREWLADTYNGPA